MPNPCDAEGIAFRLDRLGTLCNAVGWNIEVFQDEYDVTLCGVRLAPSEKLLSIHFQDLQALIQIWIAGHHIAPCVSQQDRFDMQVIVCGIPGWIASDSLGVDCAVKALNFHDGRRMHRVVSCIKEDRRSFVIQAAPPRPTCAEEFMTAKWSDIRSTLAARPELLPPPETPLFEEFNGSELRACLNLADATHWLYALDISGALQFLEGFGLRLQAAYGADVKLRICSTGHSDLPIAGFFNTALMQAYCNHHARVWMSQGLGPRVQVVIKTFAGCRVTVKIPATVTVGEIRRIWGLACHWSGVYAASRFVASGRNVLDRASIGDLQCDNVLVLHMIAPHRGGGAKSDRVVSLKSDTARWLLSQGISLASVTDIVDQLQSKAGNLQLEALLEASDKARWNKFSALCEKVNVSLPDRVQSAPAPRHVKGPDALNAPIDVASLTIEPGFFQNPDGEPTQIVRNITPKGTGVVLLPTSHATPWLQTEGAISPDPLGLLTPACHPVSTQRAYEKINVPVRDASGKPMILAARLFQFGETSIVTSSTSGRNIDTANQVHLTFSVHQDECKPDGWNALSANPVREVKRILQDQGWQGAFGRVWGRAYWKAGVRVASSAAETLIFQATVAATDTIALLKLSGISPVYVTARDTDGTAKKDYRVVWTNAARSDLIIQLARYTHYGLIKNKTGHGIRVLPEAFDDLYKEIHPGRDVPEHMQIQAHYRVEPVPLGMSIERVKEWALGIGWQAKPTKFLGATAVIIAAAAPPPKGFLSINQQPVLVTPLRDRRVRQDDRMLVAGRPFGKGASEPQTDVLQLNDPWASAASSGGKPPLPRTSRIGPMEQQLREQESEITQLRGSVQELAKAQEACASSTSAVLATAAKAQDKLRGDVTTEVGLLRNHIGHELGSIRQELKEEVAGVTEFVRHSLEQQEKRTQTSFEELKELLIQNAVANPRAAKKGRTQSAERKDGINMDES